MLLSLATGLNWFKPILSHFRSVGTDLGSSQATLSRRLSGSSGNVVTTLKRRNVADDAAAAANATDDVDFLSPNVDRDKSFKSFYVVTDLTVNSG